MKENIANGSISTRVQWGIWIGLLTFVVPLVWFIIMGWWPTYKDMEKDLSLDSDGLPLVTQLVTFMILAAFLLLPTLVWGTLSAGLGWLIAGKKMDCR